MNRPNLPLFLLAILMGTNLGCGEAEAMGKRAHPPEPAPIPAPLPPPIQVHPSPAPPRAEETDRYRQGRDLGTHNGERMIDSIRRSTIGVQGCKGQAAYEKALLAVVKSIRPPKPGAGEDHELARGYFKGYSTAFGKALRAGRVECSLPIVVGGRLPGTIIGSLLCGAGSIDVQLLDLVEVEPIYTGWTGGHRESHAECAAVAVKIARGCGIGRTEDSETVERILNDQIALGCAD